jgi:hypothetical protein
MNDQQRSKRLSQKETHNKKSRGGGMYALNFSAQLHYLHGTVQPHNPTIQNPWCIANPLTPPLYFGAESENLMADLLL